MDRYARDDFDLPPTLNSGIAHVLLTKSAHHAWWKHPRLRPGWQPDGARSFDLGTAAHAALLEGKPLHVVQIVDEKTGELVSPTDYKKKATQKARDEAKAAGKFPVLADQAPDVAAMITSARAKLAASPDLAGLGPLFAEQTAVWEHGGTWLRCRPDWMTAGHDTVISYKTTRASAEPSAFLRTALGMGYDMQAAFELAGVKAVTGVDAAYVWLVGEVAPPFACSLVGMTGEHRAFAGMRFRQAVAAWAHCLAADSWPAYSDHIERPELPAWAQAQFIERHGYQPEHVEDDPDQPIEEAMFAKGEMP